MKTYEKFCEAYSAPEKESHKAPKKSFLQSITTDGRPARATQSKAPSFKAANPKVKYSQKTPMPSGVNIRGGVRGDLEGAI